MKKKPVPNKKPFPGSHRQRQRARDVLHCQNVAGPYWRVWGGENEHVVKAEGKVYLCDCRIMMEKQNTICSHIIKVRMEVGDFPNDSQVH